MTKILLLKIYNYLRYILVVIISLCILKFIFDFYDKNKTISKNSDKNIKYQNVISEPKLQFNEKGFQFVEAEQGVENSGKYVFTDVKTHGDFGDGSAGKLEVIDNQNILIFTENPEFTIYTNKVKK